MKYLGESASWSRCRINRSGDDDVPTYTSWVVFHVTRVVVLMEHESRIYLTGFMGAGKSSVGPRVARRLRFASIDLDREVTIRLGMSVPAVFDVLGESAFRDMERELLEDTAALQDVVVSLGGGTLSQGSNLRFCLDHGFVVYLKAGVDFLAARLQGAVQPRPLLFDASGMHLSEGALRDRIRQILSAREHVYEKAHATISIEGKERDQVAREITDLFRSRTA